MNNKRTIEQLREEVAALRRRIRELETAEAERKHAEELPSRRTYDLHERNKELKCLFAIAYLVERENISLDGIIQGTADVVPSGFQYPEITCSRIILEGREFISRGFQETGWKLDVDVIVYGRCAGSLEVFYLEPRPEIDEGPFQKEERELIIVIAERLGRIIERKRGNEALIESEARLNTMLDSIGDNMTMLDRDLNIIWANKAVKNVFGEDMIGKKCYEVFPRKEKPCEPSPCLTQKAFQDGLIHSQDLKVIDKAGHIVYLQCTSNVALRDKEGRPTAVIEISRDITRQKMAEEALKIKEYAIASSIEAISFADIEGNMTDVNDAFLRLWGYRNKAEVVGKPAMDLYLREDSLQHMVEEVHDKGQWTGELAAVARDGSRFDVQASIHMITDEHGRKIGSMASFIDITEAKRAREELAGYRSHLEELVKERTRDLIVANAMLQQQITERRKAEEILAANEKRFRTYFELGLVGIAITSPEKKWIEVNDRLCEIYGYSPEELKQKTWVEMTVPENLASDLNQYNLMLEGKIDGFIKETRQIRKDGKIIDIRVSTRCVRRPDGSVDYLLGLVEDLTDRKRLEAELQKVQKLESLGILAGGIAHDFNNILVSIVGSLSLLKVYPGRDDKFHQILTRAETAAFRARDLTRQLLTFAKGGAPVKKVTSIGGLIRETTDFSLRGSKVKGELCISDHLWPVEIDDAQISQVINNLIINAQQAMPEGGVIRLQAENVILGADNPMSLDEGRYIRISIRDQGIGIPEENLHRIFDPYFTTKKDGSGLGLAISHSIIRRHGGHIMAESQVGQGTVFTLYLPALEREFFMLEDITEEEKLTGRGRILVMDDQESVREMLADMLNYLGYEVEAAGEGGEALEHYKRAREKGQGFDAVILDLTIPNGMGGREVIRKFLEADPGARVIASSGYSESSVLSDCRRYGFCGIIAKPYGIKELGETLRKVTGVTHSR